MTYRYRLVLLFLLTARVAHAGVGDPQIRTDHAWYPGELACSTFERLFATQAEVYERVVGVRPITDEQRVLAAWLWRNTHYYHGEEGAQNLWGKGFQHGGDLRTREYWTGLFSHGFGLCGTTHSQWTAEMEALLGHGRSRGVGVDGHNSFEVFLKGGAYGAGKWALLDHDISTVIFQRDGSALMSLADVQKDWQRLTKRSFAPERQHGWLVCGLHPDDGSVYRRYEVAEYLAGYSGVPPMVHLRRGETLRRYLTPGLDDGKTFVFWGLNYNTGGIPGPERAHTWVNQPESMYGSRSGTGFKPGQARYGNAVFTYKPSFASGDYREGIVAEDDNQVTFAFQSPYIIGATPANATRWGIYEPGCRNGLFLKGKAACAVSVSTDRGATWTDGGQFLDGLDLTDHVKGHRHYLLRLHTGAKALAQSGLSLTTVCQVNAAMVPRLKDGGSKVTFQASGQAVTSAGPEVPAARGFVTAGKFGTPKVTLTLATPRQERAVAVHAAAHLFSGSPPRPELKYQIDFSSDGGQTWKSLVRDWTIPRLGNEPKDFWSQSMCWGGAPLQTDAPSSIAVRFSNNGGKSYGRCEVHLVYRVARSDSTKVTFAWADDKGARQVTHVIDRARHNEPTTWAIPTGKNVQTRWVEFEPVWQ